MTQSINVLRRRIRATTTSEYRVSFDKAAAPLTVASGQERGFLDALIAEVQALRLKFKMKKRQISAIHMVWVPPRSYAF